jgi:phage shock protein PspC (stress-responsive transcriptional regulator)/predicted membrane protein
MTEQSEQTTERAPGPRRFLRSRDDRFIAGVCGGLGRYFNADPVLFRVSAVVLVFLGGVAFLAYPALWLFTSVDDGTGQPSGPSPIRRLLGGTDGRIKAGRVAAIIAAIVGGAMALTALVAGAVWATGSGGGGWVAAALIAIGLAAVAGALTGRRRAAWLLVPALVIAAPAGFVAAADVRFDGGFGDKHYRPTALSALPAHGYKLGAGRLRVDLRNVSFAPGTTTRLPIQVGMGAATIIVPAQVCVQSDTRVGAGYVNVLGDDEGGLDVNRDLSGARSAAPRVQLNAKVGMGALEVVHTPEEAQFDDRHRGPFDSGHNRPLDNAACNGAVAG